MQHHLTDRVDFSKLGVPSWRIEQKYAPGVLVGNWSEERYKYPDIKYKHNTTYRNDFQPFGSSRPDVNIRRNAKLFDEGLPADTLFRHHGKAYDNMHITLYDEHYNGRWREKNLPPLRQWDHQTLKWLPERTDHPLQGQPTNWGLRQQKEARALAKLKEEKRPEYESTYMGSYQNTPLNALQFARYATAKRLSSKLLPSNNTNSNLQLRGTQNFRMPECMPQELTQISI